MEIPVIKNIYDYNKEHAQENRRILKDNKIMTVNILSSPGAGKTSLILETIKNLKNKKIGVIEGDISSTHDAEKLKGYTEEIVQINTGGTCHLNASMVFNALKEIDLKIIDILFIENVGNLICPVGFDLGEDYKVLLSSVSEGDDKPVKYPKGFAVASLVILNKIDLYDYFEFNREFFLNSVRELNPSAEIIELSCKSNKGMKFWLDWLDKKEFMNNSKL